MTTFKDLGLTDVTINAVTKKGFTTPTPIQEKTIPLLLQGDHDVIAQAQTGTGKTACFALPILEQLEENKQTQALILTPTRELALQVATEIESLKGERKIRVTAIYGGAPITKQMDELRKGSQIVVGTPGRIMDLIDRKKLIISNLTYMVLDEADEMLNMGFIEDIEQILSKTNDDKRMLLFSATMPREIIRIAKKFAKEYELIKDETKALTIDLIEQTYYDIMGKDRYTALKRLIAYVPDFHGLIFCKTRAEVDTVSNKLIHDDYAAAAIHGDISQGQRENTLRAFRDKKINILIATDVAARGIDVNDLNIVINYSLPQSPETYVHRIGRTGRAGNKGKAVTFLMPSERSKLKFVEKIIKQKIAKGTLPGIEEIISAKKEHIKTSILEIMQNSNTKEYTEIAKKLLAIGDAEKVVGAVLSYSFSKQLDASQFKEVSKVTGYEKSSRGDSRGRRGGNRRGSSRREGSYRGSRDSGRSGGRDRRGSSSSGRRDSGRSDSRSREGGRSSRDSERSSSRDRSDGGRSQEGGFKKRSDRGDSKGRSDSRSRNSGRSDNRGRDSEKGYVKKDSYKSGGRDRGDSKGRSDSRSREGGRSSRDSGRSSSRDKPRGRDSSKSEKPKRSYGGSNTQPSGKKKDYSKKPRRDR